MNKALVTIVDYGMGNIGSVSNALEAIGARVTVSDSKEDIETATHLILPGVGAFPDGMQKLRESGVLPSLTEAVIENMKPILGICLGMQMFAERSEEGESIPGLGWIQGAVRRFDIDESLFCVPHIGWNDVAPSPASALYTGIKSTIFYFVHSYHLVPVDSAIVSGTTDHGGTFTSSVEQGNIFGVQFHPEKSQDGGLAVLHNFLRVRSATL